MTLKEDLLEAALQVLANDMVDQSALSARLRLHASSVEEREARLAAAERQVGELTHSLEDAEGLLTDWWNSMGDGTGKGPFPGLFDETKSLVPKLRRALASPVPSEAPAPEPVALRDDPVLRKLLHRFGLGNTAKTKCLDAIDAHLRPRPPSPKEEPPAPQQGTPGEAECVKCIACRKCVGACDCTGGPQTEPDCTCYELTGGHQPGCYYNRKSAPAAPVVEAGPSEPPHIDLTCQCGNLPIECRWPGHEHNAHLRSHPAWKPAPTPVPSPGEAQTIHRRCLPAKTPASEGVKPDGAAAMPISGRRTSETETPPKPSSARVQAEDVTAGETAPSRAAQPVGREEP